MQNKKTIIFSAIMLLTSTLISACAKNNNEKVLQQNNIDSVFKTNNIKNDKKQSLETKEQAPGVYENKKCGFSFKYPKNLNLIYGQEDIITNAQGNPPTFFAQDGDIWIEIKCASGDEYKKVLAKVDTKEESRSLKLGKETKTWKKVKIAGTEAVALDAEYSDSKLLKGGGIYKTVYIKNKNNQTIIIYAHIPYQNIKQIKVFDDILKTIKL